MRYFLFTVAGVVLATLSLRLAPPDDALPPRVLNSVRLAAIAGAILGAHLFELPAELYGWAPPVAEDGHTVLGARTVLGGMLGGWLGVELCKLAIGYRGPTGDRFALPLAVALAVGRLGCVFTGCCPGAPLAASDPWARVSLALGHGARFPATLVEAWFHALAALALVALLQRGVLKTARLALYLTCYAVVRFWLETLREVPRPFAGLSWYQVLCAALLLLAGVTLVRRATARA